jgi:pimeloyl-ACP methyl ester carboxylesterase
MFQFGVDVSSFLLFPEHRFFGGSLPDGMNSFDPDMIDKLTIEQALQDYVTVIQWAITEFNLDADIQIIAFGGSYPGELASYLRVAFPELVDGALASSAPLRYHPGLPRGTKNGAFYAVITADFAKKHSDCPNMVRKAIADMHGLFSSSSGRATIEQQLQLCSPLENSDAQLRLLDLWIENAFATLGMENYPYALGASDLFVASFLTPPLLSCASDQCSSFNLCLCSRDQMACLPFRWRRRVT